jgi:hypothetical protein
MSKRIILALVAILLSSVFCTSQDIGQTSPTPDVNTMVNATLTALSIDSLAIIPTNTPIPTTTTAPATGGNIRAPFLSKRFYTAAPGGGF